MFGRSIRGVVGLAFAAAACYPGRSVDSTTEFASVTTSFDTEADFATVTRYALPDTVMYVPRGDDEVPAVTQATILAQLREELNALGWTEVVAPSATNPADVYVGAVITTTLNVYYYWGWWDYWYWYPYWPLGYGASSNWYYPPYWYTYAYTTGTLLISMVDARTTSPGAGPDRVPIIWSAGVNGVLADATTNVAIATAGIQQAFEQSPYLRAQR
jgi:hypothetical protein